MSGKREELNAALKDAMRARDEVALSTIRMVLAKLKEKDIEARATGNADGIPDQDMLSMMQGLIKQRQESARMYRDGAREELAAREEAEIVVIERFLPRQMSDDELKSAIAALVTETGASSIRDMGRVMAEVKAKYAGQADMTRASALVKERLAG